MRWHSQARHVDRARLKDPDLDDVRIRQVVWFPTPPPYAATAAIVPRKQLADAFRAHLRRHRAMPFTRGTIVTIALASEVAGADAPATVDVVVLLPAEQAVLDEDKGAGRGPTRVWYDASHLVRRFTVSVGTPVRRKWRKLVSGRDA